MLISMHKMEESKCLIFYQKYEHLNFSFKLSYHKVYFSAIWCKTSLLYDQTIEDINIFSPAFLVELRGWLKLSGGSNYPTLP